MLNIICIDHLECSSNTIKKPEIGLQVPFLVKQLFGTKTTNNIFLFGLIIIL